MRRAAALALAALWLVSCGGAGSATSATLGILDAAADVRVADQTSFVAAENGERLAVGDDVRTDLTGFAQITYPDGSLTRLDRQTTFRLVALGDAAAGADVQLELDAGRVWNRVKDLGADGRFEVDTAAGVAAVRGTAFDVDCAFGCLFRVFDGAVQVAAGDGTNVDVPAGRAVQVAADGTPGPMLVIAFADDDPWLSRNLELDRGAGFPALAPPAGPDVGVAGLGGMWDVRFTSTPQANDPGAPPGSASDDTFTIRPSCESGPCDGAIEAGEAGTIDVRFVDGVHVIDDTEVVTSVECQPNPAFNRRVTGTLVITGVVGDAPDQAALFVGTIREEFESLPEAIASGCAADGVRIRDSIVRGVLRP